MKLPNPSALPQGLEVYRHTDVFTAATVPRGLLKDHSTKEGTWGVINVIEGQLRYCVTDDRRDPFAAILSPGGTPGLVEPTILHHVELLGPVRFYVEFHRAGKQPDREA